MVAATLACSLWLVLALPNAALLPGINTFGDRSVVISLQSALLGLDEGKGTDESARAAAAALGPAGSRLLAAQLDAIRSGSVPHAVPAVVRLAVGAPPSRDSTAPPTSDSPSVPDPQTPPVQPDGGPGAGPSGPPAEPDPGPSPEPRSSQTITFSSTAPANALVGGTYAVRAAASSGLPVAISVDRTSAGICSLDGSTVSLDGGGTCTIDADQEGDTRFSAAPRAQQAFEVALARQTVSFISRAPGAGVIGDSYAVRAVASSGLPVSVDVAAGSARVCSVSGSTVSLDRAGTCTVVASQAGNRSFAPADAETQSFPVARASQTIFFTSAAPLAAGVGDTYAVSATASSGLPVTLTIDPASADVCSLSGGSVSLDATGACVVHADQAGDERYAPAPQGQQAFTIGRLAQTISFSSTPPSGASVGSTYAVWAESTSGLPVALSVDPVSAGVCSLAGGIVSLVGEGLCSLEGDQAGNARYAPAARAQQTFAVGRLAQTVSFTTQAPVGALVGDTYTVGAVASSGLPVALSVDPGSTGICTLAGATLSIIGTGSCIVDADQAGNASYLPAVEVGQTFTAALGRQAVAFTSTAPSAGLVDDTYAVTAAASSGLPISLSIDPGSAGVCSLSGSTVSLDGVGTCAVVAGQTGNSRYAAAPQAMQTFTVSQASQTVSFASTAPSGAVVGDTYSVSATASSGLPVTITTSGSGVCTASGGTVSLVGSGSCVVRAHQTGSHRYAPAGPVSQTFAVSPASQTITFNSSSPLGATVGGSYAVDAAAGSGLPVALSIEPASAGVCSLSGSTVSFDGVGTCTVDADQAGDGTYAAAPTAQQSFLVGSAPRSPQTIAFGSAPPALATAGGSYAVSATASSGLAVSFSIAPASAGVCSLSGSAVSFDGAGTCMIDADQAGDASYQAAPQTQQSFSIAAAPPSSQTITFISTPPGGATVGGSYAVGATASSGLSVSFGVDAASAGVCTIGGTTVSFTGAGTCTIDADQPGNASWQAAPQQQQTFTVGSAPRSPQTISFTSGVPGNAVVGDSYSVGATASSGLAVSFGIAAASAGVCTISGASVSLTGAGTCVIDADQPGNASWQAAPQAHQSFAVGPAPQTVSFTSTAPGSATVGGSYTVSATASSGLTVSLGIASASAGVCTISGTNVSFTGAGTCTVNADQAGNASYSAAPQVQQSFTVASGSRTPQTITFTSAIPSNFHKNDTYTVSAVASSGLPVSFEVDPSSANYCSISGHVVTGIVRGTCKIWAYQLGDSQYQPALASQTLNVK